MSTILAGPRTLQLTMFALMATTMLVPAQAQLRGNVGQMPADPDVQTTAPPTAAAQGPVLPSTEQEIAANRSRRTAREQQRVVSSAGNPVLDPRTRGQVLRPVRGTIALRRPPNRAVPLRSAVRDPAQITAGQPLPQTIAPGLTETPVTRRKMPQADDAYAPLGVRIGGVILRPGLEANVGYDSNPLRNSSNAKVKGSKLYQAAGDVSLQSDWSRHQLQLDLRGTYNYYTDVDDANRPTLDAKLTFRGDLSDQANLNLELREKIDSQRPGSPDLTSSVKGRPLTYQSGVSTGYTQRIGHFALTGTALFDRYDFEDGKTRRGAIVSQADREFNQYGGKLRGAYEITPGIAPYLEAGADRRTYDQTIDTSGYRRSSHGVTARAGSTFELTRTLTGELSAGYGWRDYADQRLKIVSGALLDGSLAWEISPLTRATARAGSEFLETTQVGSSGAINRRVGLLVTHDLLRNLQLGTNVDYSYANYSGVRRIEQSFAGGLRLDYKIDRNFVVRASYSYERAISSIANNSSTAHIFLLGLRAQR